MLSGCFDHSFDIFYFRLIQRATGSHNKSAIPADGFNQSQTFIFDLLNTAGLQQRRQHTPGDTIVSAQSIFASKESFCESLLQRRSWSAD
jgi:hypothetical protein